MKLITSPSDSHVSRACLESHTKSVCERKRVKVLCGRAGGRGLVDGLPALNSLLSEAAWRLCLSLPTGARLTEGHAEAS